MEKYELDDSLKEEIRSRTLGEGFMKLVQTVRRGGGTFKIALRPVEIGGVRKYQAEMTEGRDVRVKNFDANGAAVPDAVVTERFVFIPAPGRHAAGETLEFTIGKAPGAAKAGKGK